MRRFAIVSLFIVGMFYSSPVFPLELSEGLALQAEKWTEEKELLLFFDKSVVTATKTKRKVTEAPAIATIITDKEIRDMGARTLVDVLDTVPGFESIRGRHGNQIIVVRGIATQKSNKIKIMIDDHSISEPLSGSAIHFNFSEMPVDFIKRIEIIRGPGSALYGQNAFLAVINIISKRAEDIDGIILEAGGGSFSTQNYDVLMGKGLGSFQVSTYADYLESEGARLFIEEDRTGNRGRTNDWLDRFYSNTSISYKDFNLQFFIMDKKSGTNTSTNYTVTDDSFFDVTQLFAELKYEHRFNNRLLLKPRIYFDLFDLVMHIEQFQEGALYKGNIYPEGVLLRRSAQTHSWGGELEVHYSLFENNDVLAGYQYQYDYIRDTSLHATFDPRTDQPLMGGFQDISDRANFIDPDYQEHLWAFYLQDEWAITDKIFLTLGGRVDHYSRFDPEYSPRLSLVLKPLDALHLKLLYGEAFRAPDILEQTSRNNLTSRGNPDIKPEKIRTYEIGLGYDPIKYFQGEFNLFYNQIEDIITLDQSSIPWLYINGEEIRTWGVEASVKSEYSKDTYLKINYSYADPQQKDVEGHWRDLPDVSKHKFNIVLNSYIWKYLNGNVSILFRGEKKRSRNDSRDEIPANYLVNLNLLAHSLYPNLEISTSVYNLFDRKYADPAPPVLPFDMPREGRSFLGFVRYKF